MRYATAVFGMIILSIAFSTVVAANPILSDIAKEKRWSEQIEATLFDGKIVWLTTDRHEFLAIDTPAANADTARALIVVHGIGVHPDWEQVVQPVRVEMTYRGWRTLSIQMPILPNNTEPAEYVPLFSEVPGRIDAAVTYLHSQGVSKIFIVAHSMGAAMSAYFLARKLQSSIDGFIAVGMNAGQKDKTINTAKSLEKITIPILEIFGSEDLPIVLDTAELRTKAAAKAGNTTYSQMVIQGADHFFNGHDEELVNRIDAWLEIHD